MKDLFNQISNGLGGLGGLGDKLNGALGGQQKADAPSGQGTGNALGDMVKSAGGLQTQRIAIQTTRNALQ